MHYADNSIMDELQDTPGTAADVAGRLGYTVRFVRAKLIALCEAGLVVCKPEPSRADGGGRRFVFHMARTKPRAAQ